MRDQRIAPRDPIPQREALYILVDKPVGGGGSDAEANRFPVFLNDERLVTFAKIVGGVRDENILQMLQTAKGFRRLVHSIGVSVVSDAPDRLTSPCLELIVMLLATNLASSLMETSLLPFNTRSKRLPSFATT